ncbi:MAG: nucleotidyltransferase domain-containing protein, partial [Bacteroidota bacterium]
MDRLPNILSRHLNQIQTLCKEHHVARLWVFGSVLRNDFSEGSDIDLLYEWNDQAISEESYLTNLW